MLVTVHACFPPFKYRAVPGVRLDVSIPYSFFGVEAVSSAAPQEEDDRNKREGRATRRCTCSANTKVIVFWLGPFL